MADSKVPPASLDPAADNSKNSPLLALPPELRNKIYALVLDTSSLIRVGIMGPYSSSTMSLKPYHRCPPWVMMHLVCRKIHKEATRVFYSSGTLVLSKATWRSQAEPGNFLTTAKHFLHTLGSQASMVTTVILSLASISRQDYEDSQVPSPSMNSACSRLVPFFKACGP